MKAACIALAAGVLLAAGAAAETSYEKTLPADPKGEVEVSNVAGSVTVSGWDRNEVQVTGTLGRSVERLDFESDRARTLVKVVLRRGNHRGSSSDTDLQIRVPKQSRISVNTVSAEITATDVSGPQRLQSVSGDISSDISQEAEIKTVSGNLLLRGTGKAGVLSLTTVSGDASVSRAGGEVTANTVSGELELNLEEITRARLRTTSGDVNMVGRLKGDGRVDAETISGQLTVELKGGVDAQVDIESFSGSIDSCGRHKADRTQKYGPGSEMRFREGKGSGRVRLESLSGDISICTR